MFITDRLPHGWQVLATILAMGALFSLGWALSQAGQLDLAATGLSFFAVRFLASTGMPESRVPREFRGTWTIIQQAQADYRAFMGSRGILAKALIAATWTVAFLVFRTITVFVLHIVTTPWTALAAGLLVAAAITSPYLFRAAGQWITRPRTRIEDPADVHADR